MSRNLERPLSEVLFITELRDWAREKGDEGYNFVSCRACALAQFLVASGRAQSPRVAAWEWTDDERVDHDFPDGLAVALVREPNTFSALAQRLDALLPASVERVRG